MRTRCLSHSLAACHRIQTLIHRAAKKIIMTMSYNEAVEKFIRYKKNGLVGKAKHLIDNIDNLLTCINIEFGRDPSCFKRNVSSLFKLNLYEEDIKMGSNDPNVTDIISVAKFMLQNNDLLADDIANVGKAQRSLDMNERETIIIESEDEELPDIVSPVESANLSSTSCLKVKGIRAFHKLKPYAKTTLPQPSASTSRTSSTPSKTLSETDWNKREEQLLVAHQSELIKFVQEAKDELLLCVICLSNPKEYTLIPCGHTFCAECLAKLKAKRKCCFFCRTKVRSSVRMRLTN